MKKILIVGGTFDNNGGKKSGLIDKIVKTINNRNDVTVELYNGGYVSALKDEIIEKSKENNIVLWMPNVANTEEKIRDVKKINPKTILITSKRNDDNKYNFAELITRALEIKANLTIEFKKVVDKKFNMMIFDPLGNEFYNGTDIDKMTNALMNRAIKLTEFKRCPTTHSNEVSPEVPNEKEFFTFARSCSDIFHNLINPAAGTKRFLGNMSFRCQNGFPSFRGENGIIFVSRRNVNKEEITKESFVPTYLDENDNVIYFGDNKPSVDTPIQLRLYKMYPHMNYMIHAHCYFKSPDYHKFGRASYTYHPIPCGAIEEVDEIEWTIANEIECDNGDDAPFIAVNLIGHGCILMAKDVSYFTELMKYKNNCFIKRPVPEQVNKQFREDLFDIFRKRTPHIKFENKPLDLDTFSALVRTSSDEYLGMVQDEYCCHGSLFNCWEEPYGVGIWSATRTMVNDNIISVYKNYLENHPERIFVAKCSGKTYVAISARDINKCDYRIYL